MESSPNNVFIDFTKWILKWLLIIILGLGVLGGISFAVYQFTQTTIPMIALQCIPKKVVKVVPKKILPKKSEGLTDEELFGWSSGIPTEKFIMPKFVDPYADVAKTKKIDGLYLVMKKRFEDKPEGIYQSPLYQRDFNLNTSETDFRKIGHFRNVDGDNYVFHYVSINRKTLLIDHRGLGSGKCKEISADTFYELVAERIKREKKELKF